MGKVLHDKPNNLKPGTENSMPVRIQVVPHSYTCNSNIWLLGELIDGDLKTDHNYSWVLYKSCN